MESVGGHTIPWGQLFLGHTVQYRLYNIILHNLLIKDLER